MYKIAHIKETENLKLPKKVVEVVRKIITILDREYGEERDVDDGDGGYVIVIEDKDDLTKFQETFVDLEDIIAEYVDKIECEGGISWINALILMNNEFGVSIIMPMEIASQTLIDDICEEVE